MKIDSGLLTGQVLQRDRKNKASATFRGEGAATGEVEARVCRDGRALKGLDWRKVGRCSRGVLSGKLSGIPVGGPYQVELRVRTGCDIADTLLVSDVYVGDVWFMAGQSNMQGGGIMAGAAKPHPLVRCFYMRDEWGLAADPLHFLPEAVDSVFRFGAPQAAPAEAAKQRRRATIGVGLGVWFGTEMVRRTGGVPQGLVSCALGGTSMDQWSPDKKAEGGASLYGAMLRRFKKLNQPIKGMLWYQGCADGYEWGAKLYPAKMMRLVAETRKDFGQPDLPWLMVQIGRYSACREPKGWNMLQEAQRVLPTRIRNLDLVPSADLELDDCVHIGAAGFPRLALRLARIADRLALGNRSEKGGIQPGRITLRKRQDKTGRKYEELRIDFTNVVGGLRSQGRPTGFSSVNAGSEVEDLYKCRLEGNAAILEWPAGLLAGVAHAQGAFPYVNITDARDMAVPVFGPLSFQKQSGGAYATVWDVTETAFTAKDLGRMKYPGAVSGLAWRRARRFIGGACPWLAMPGEIWDARRGVYLFRTRVTAESTQKVRFSAGSDSPFKAWLNGREIIKALAATNPCTPDQYQRDVTLKQGENECLFAFDARDGKGWGVCLHLLNTKRH